MIARVTLPSGRVVLDTGKVKVGLLATTHKPPAPGSHAELMQRVLCTPLPKVWHDAPPVIDLKPSLRKRVALMLRGFR